MNILKLRKVAGTSIRLKKIHSTRAPTHDEAYHAVPVLPGAGHERAGGVVEDGTDLDGDVLAR